MAGVKVVSVDWWQPRQAKPLAASQARQAKPARRRRVKPSPEIGVCWVEKLLKSARRLG